MEKNFIAFVDDKRLYANNWKVNKPKSINAQLEQAATTGMNYLQRREGAWN